MATEYSAEITQAISRFEAAWAAGANPQLREFIPHTTDVNVELVAELAAVDLERRLKAGETIRVETYLQQFPQLVDAPEHVVNLVVAEFQHRCRATPGLAIDEYLQRFPQYGEQLQMQLAATEETLVGGDGFVTQSITPATKEAADETADGLLRRMVELGLVSQQTIERRRKSLPATAQQDQHLIDELLKQGDVTTWQLKQLRAGQKMFVLENGRYLLLDELGKGGMGAVYRARHIGLNRDVALKTIDPRQAKNKQLIGRFQREITVCAKLQHEHIVQAYDMGCHENVHFLVLEYVEGADLASIVKRDGPLAPDETAAIGLQGAAALVYAHSQGIVHRDIKPHNILLSTDGIAKLLDMGLASNNADDGQAEALTSLTQTGMVLGTADYMPPEQAADLAKVDGRSDIYSLGATLYYLLTGQPPFPGGDMMSKMHRLANEEPAPIGQLRPDCARELTDVVERMLAKRPEGRYQSAVEVVQALQPLAAERIAGRHVMTRAVHTAAEADTATPHAGTVAVTPFALATDETVATSMLRRKPQGTSNRWWLGGLAGVLLLSLCIGVIAWSLGSGESGGASLPSDKVDAVPVAQHPSAVRDEIPGHYGRLAGNVVMVSALSPDASRLATGGPDGRVYVWDIQLQKPVLCYRGHDSSVIGVCWSSDGNLIASRSTRDGTIDVWHSSSGVRRARTVTSGLTAQWNAIAFAPGRNEIAYTTHRLIVNSNKYDVRRWNFDSQDHTLISAEKPSGTAVNFQGHTRLRYSPDGSLLASWKETGELNVYHLSAGERIINLEHSGNVLLRDVGFLPDGRIVVVSEHEAQFFNSTTGELIESKPLPAELRSAGKSEIVRGVAVSGSGSHCLLWISGRRVHRFNLATWRIESTSASVVSRGGQTEWYASADLTHFVVGGGDGAALIGPTADPALSIRMPTQLQLGFGGAGQPLREPELLGEGRYLRASHTEGCWDLHTAAAVFQFPQLAYIHSDGTIDAVVASINAGSARVLRYADRQAVRQGRFEIVSELKDPQQYVRRLQWSGDGRLVYGISNDRNTVRIWNAATGDIARSVALAKETGWAVHLSRNGDTLVAQGQNVVVRRIDVFDRVGISRTIELPANFSLAYFQNAALSLNGDRFIAHADGEAVHLMMWDTRTGRLLYESNLDDLPQHQHLRLRFADSGRFFAMSDVVFDAETGERLWRCPERTTAPTPMTGSFFPNDDYFVLPVHNRYQIWNWKTNEKVLTLYSLPEKHWAFVDPQCNYTGTRLAPQYLRFLLKEKAGE